RGGAERGSGTGARTEGEHRQVGPVPGHPPVDGRREALGEQPDVEAQVPRACVGRGLLGAEQVQQDGGVPGLAQGRGHLPVPRAAAAGAGAVGEDDDAAGPVGHGDVRRQPGGADVDLLGGAHGRPAARSRWRRTSSSVVCPKSAYAWPTAVKRSGTHAQTTSSASRVAHGSAAPAGTATTRRDGSWLRSAASAARMEAPVARPSSTTMTTFPATGTGGLSPR